MITHFSQLQLQTVSIHGVKQFYHEQLQFPIVYQSDDEIQFQPTDVFILTFKEVYEPLIPAHIAFEVPFSEFLSVVSLLEKAGVSLLAWPDGRTIDNFEHGSNLYFRDGDGNLLEIITHTYIKEEVLIPSGMLKILNLREIGFPVDSVISFRELLVNLFDFKLGKVSDLFTFAIGGTAHAVICSKKRRWIPISMFALPPTMNVSIGVTDRKYIDKVKARLEEKEIVYAGDDELSFKINEYTFSLKVTTFPEELPTRLNLPHSRLYQKKALRRPLMSVFVTWYVVEGMARAHTYSLPHVLSSHLRSSKDARKCISFFLLLLVKICGFFHVDFIIII
ncbi:VOC family protein [Paenibacillus eucommiae]|uniref:VOC domain-containing protein n=1 Tax=Paenibacillus eucommiae TaxID=1355755 RepID=A0ABS4ISS0_9BACL|nr:glyoxalase/bleomycin resistance/dioxygenase family protein [Paenibacillus eucommiae]MBP1989921.1 hypothetical protein [Paenibacillus eucommiae]